MSNSDKQTRGIPWILTLGALGVVYGDIGTSPLYAVRECFLHSHGLSLSHDNILGVLSLIFWSLILIVTVKYLLVVLRADNRGEGGILALMTLASPHRIRLKSKRPILTFIGILGAALMYGDGVITPAISVLSAVEGLKIVTPLFEPYVLLITVVILFLLFYFQCRGTGKIGAVFGPIIVIWFITIGALGLSAAVRNPEVFLSLSPYYAVKFLSVHGFASLQTLGGVFLVVTGGEALYADMGHFGRRPIQYGWFLVALPSLLFNYMGQGALLLQQPSAIENPFYHLAPEWALVPLVVLATMATVIASQAVISGAFSLTRQAVQLGYLPRLTIEHTSDEEIGQIYVPLVNWILLIMTIWLVLEFGSSSGLASAYGLAVSATMMLTSALVFFVIQRLWRWHSAISIAVCGLFLTIETVFLSANLMKIKDGGWVAMVLAAVIVVVMTTWQRGRQILGMRLAEVLVPLDEFMKGLERHPLPRTPGTAIFMCRNNQRVPAALLHNARHNKILHERVILLQIIIEEEARVEPADRMECKTLHNGFELMTLRFGYMEDHDVVDALTKIEGPTCVNALDQVTFFLGRETLFATNRPGMAMWRERLFAFMSRNAQPATNYFGLPTDRVVEIGLQVEL